MSGDWQRRATVAALIALCALLYGAGLNRTGILGPDEPRYASIAREMARSGDWLTPRLWGDPWFEKPPLTYWMMALAFRAGLDDDLAPRVPIALASALFVVWYWRRLSREFGERAGLYSAVILATTAGWLAYSRTGVTDLPLAVSFSAAMLLALPWLVRGEAKGLSGSAALLGLAVLAKGFVAPALALPLLWMGRRRWRAWLQPSPILSFLVVAAPWYLFVSLRYGRAFWQEFLLEHHVARVYTDRLQHVQPWWFYLPVLAAGLFPWTPLAALLARRQLYGDVRLRFFAAWALFGLAFFSLVRNKLPGYLLPLLPAVCALIGVALDRVERVRWTLAISALLLALVPLAAGVLPSALEVGIRKAEWPEWPWTAIAGALPLAAWCWWWGPRRRELAVAAIAVGLAAAVLWMSATTLVALDRQVSVRSFWRETQGRAAACCLEGVDRERRYGLNYYAGRALPDCGQQPAPCLIRRTAGGTLELAAP